MDINAVKELIAALEASSLTHLHYEDGSTKVILDKASGQAAIAGAAVSPAAQAQPLPPQAAPSDAPAADEHVVTAPIVGTVYRAREQGQSPLVSVGDTVNEGDTLCLIEAMKVFGDVNAPISGVVRKIHFTDGELAEFGAPLVTIGKLV